MNDQLSAPPSSGGSGPDPCPASVASPCSARHILVIVADPDHRARLCAAVAGCAEAVSGAGMVTQALGVMRSDPPDLLVLDPRLPDRDGMAAIGDFLALQPRLPVIVLGAEAEAARQAGARAALEAEPEPAALCAAIEALLLETQAAGLGRSSGVGGFIGGCPPLRLLYERLRAAARSTAPVFITGESGTGKSLAARAIHDLGPRARGRFITMPCAGSTPERMEREFCGYLRAGVPGALADRPGAAELASGGTLVLEDLCELGEREQAKLLGFLETGQISPIGAWQPRRVDVRLVCTSSRDPHAAIAAGRLRADLYHRLCAFAIHMPALRDCREDLEALAFHTLGRIAQEDGRGSLRLSAPALARLGQETWRGNVRELANVLRGAAFLTDDAEIGLEAVIESLSAHSFAAPGRRAPAGPATAPPAAPGETPPAGAARPDAQGPDAQGPGARGPDMQGPDMQGFDMHGFDMHGFDARGPGGASPGWGRANGAGTAWAGADPLSPPAEGGAAGSGAAGLAPASLPGPAVSLPLRTLAQIERAAIEAAIARNGESIPRAARELDVAPSTLYRKIAAWTAREAEAADPLIAAGALAAAQPRPLPGPASPLAEPPAPPEPPAPDGPQPGAA